MKRLLFCVVYIFSLATLQAQVPDEVIASTDDLQYEDSVTVSDAIRPTLKSQSKYSHFFFEGILALQQNGSFGYGATVAYLPKAVGGYVSASIFQNCTMLTGGLAVRPLASFVRFDWQLFGGMAYAQAIETSFTHPVGFEIGTRFGANARVNGGRFAWWSLSLSRLYINNKTYYTLGLSVDLMALSGLWIVF